MTGCIEPDCCAPPSSTSFFVHISTSEGSNLLDPNSEGSIDLNNTRQYLLVGGEAKMVKYESSGAVLDYPYGVIPTEENGVYGVKFSFENTGNQKEIEGIIQWNEVLADSLTFTFNSTKRPTFLSRISQKEIILWDVETDPNSQPIITLAH